MNVAFGKILCCGIAFLAYAGYSQAEDVDPNFALVSAQVKNICQKLSETSIPSADQPDAALADTLKKCDAADLYYGFSQPANFIQARQCAYLKQDYGVLAMIYANARGVSRNWDLAVHFACKAGFSPDEIEGRVLHLVQLRDKHWQGSNFDICDDVTSGYMMGVCASNQEQLSKAQRHNQLTTLTASWSETDKTALTQLQQAAEHFFAVRASNEVDHSGTGRAAFEIEERAVLKADLLTSLQNLENHHFPQYSAAQAADADKQLNTVYQKIIKNNDFSVGTVDRSSVQKTQVQWLKYRDAWIAFGKIKYPQVDADSWKTWLAEKRIKMLQDLADSTNG